MLSTTIDQDIKKAMLAKDTVKLRGLRAVKAAILLAKTEKGGNEELSADAEVKLLQKLAKQRRESADIYIAQNRNDLAQIEQEELEVIESFLPKQLSEEEIGAVVEQIIAKTGAQGMKDMGKVMSEVNNELSGQDGKIIAAVVKRKLSE